MQIIRVRIDWIAVVAAAISILSFSVLLIASAQASSGAPTVRVAQGALEGINAGATSAFLGVPYAAAPVGALRWRAPQTAVPWAGVRTAKSFGFACPQDEYKGVKREEMSEDCLTLNVWTPSLNASAKLPVIVWVHGGGMIRGASRVPVYDGKHLAADGAVVVTINYRLHHFGFFAHPELTQEAKRFGEPTGNFALYDTIAALRWVKANVAQFGGNPNNVTLSGESGGALVALAVGTIRQADGLYQRLIVQSGLPRMPFVSFEKSVGAYLSAYDRSNLMASTVLGQDVPAPLQVLRSKPWEEIQDRLKGVDGLLGAGITLDTQYLVRDIKDSIINGQFTKVPLIIGSTGFEGLFLRRALQVETSAMLTGAAEFLGALKADYARYGRLNDEILADAIWGDSNVTEPVRFAARYHAKFGRSAYAYNFNFMPEGWRGWLAATPHGVDVLYTFGTFETLTARQQAQVTQDSIETSNRMRRYWVNFARTGNPNGSGLVQWPAFVKGQEQTLVFVDQGQDAPRDYLKPRLDMFEALAARRNGFGLW